MKHHHRLDDTFCQLSRGVNQSFSTFLLEVARFLSGKAQFLADPIEEYASHLIVISDVKRQNRKKGPATYKKNLT